MNNEAASLMNNEELQYLRLCDSMEKSEKRGYLNA